MPWPKPEELAILTVGGMKFQDWETVMVRHCLYEVPWYHFRFTCSEGMPLAKNWAAMRIMPGMECTVTLAGILAISGMVSTRQVFVDAKRHHIEIQGNNMTASLAAASVISKTGEWKDVTYKKFAEDVIKPFGFKLVEEGGTIPAVKFPRISIPPGTSAIDALDIPLRSLGSVKLTSNASSDVVAAVGPNGSSDTVYEGELGRPSYLEAREIIYNLGMAKGIYGIGQKPGSNDEWGAKVASVPFLGNSFSESLAGKYSPQALPLEVPAWSKDHLKGRTGADRDWQSEDQVTVYATVQGWLRPSGGLWQRNQVVRVVSPMLVMKGEIPFTAKSVVFTQDNQSGTRTTLELCNPAALGGLIPQGPGGG